MQAVSGSIQNQPGAAAALSAAVARGPSHAYLFAGPAGTGKRQAARSFAADILADAADVNEADSVRRRAMLVPSPHPDLIWLEPTGLHYRVEEIRERVIRPAQTMPYEGGRRVLVVEASEAMREESQNALLKTLEEPPSHTHLILLSDSVDSVLPTVRSRCQVVSFQPLPAPALLEALGDVGADAAVSAAARLAGGDLARARLLLGPPGRQLRKGAYELASSTLKVGSPKARPWGALLSAAEAAGGDAEEKAEERLAEEEEYGFKLNKTDRSQAIRREARRARTEHLDLGLELLATWYRDLAMVNQGVNEVVHNCDRLDLLEPQATEVETRKLGNAIELVADARRRLRLNVSEELLLEALQARLLLQLAA